MEMHLLHRRPLLVRAEVAWVHIVYGVLILALPAVLKLSGQSLQSFMPVQIACMVDTAEKCTPES